MYYVNWFLNLITLNLTRTFRSKAAFLAKVDHAPGAWSLVIGGALIVSCGPSDGPGPAPGVVVIESAEGGQQTQVLVAEDLPG